MSARGRFRYPQVQIPVLRRLAGTWREPALTAMGNVVDILSMDRRGFPWLALLAFLGGCSGGGSLTPLSSAEVESPTEADSGEPFLSRSEDGVRLSWLERTADGEHELRLASFTEDEWAPSTVVVRSDRMMANWADFPSVVPAPDGSLWAHWLERGEAGGYGIRIARSTDGGASWSEPWTPHEDASSTDHGFVATVPIGNGMGYAWLDGRAFAAPAAERAETALYFRVAGADGPAGAEAPIDPRVCDCCQTDAALTAEGPVLVYRDRSDDEVRDIHVISWTDIGWGEPRAVHADGWETGACPVNGPAVDARSERVVVAWFTAAGGIPRVKVAFSEDSAETFAEPHVVDDGDPAGRVDVVMLEDGSALVSWLERTEGDWSDVRVRRVTPDGRATPSERVSASTGERVGGFPRMAPATQGRVLIAWTDVTDPSSRVRVAMVDVSATTISASR